MPELNPEQLARQQIEEQRRAFGWRIQDYNLPFLCESAGVETDFRDSLDPDSPKFISDYSNFAVQQYFSDQGKHNQSVCHPSDESLQIVDPTSAPCRATPHRGGD